MVFRRIALAVVDSKGLKLSIIAQFSVSAGKKGLAGVDAAASAAQGDGGMTGSRRSKVEFNSSSVQESGASRPRR